ncbi:hypothetical protein ACIBO2_45815 [Nonomuraea sp. NPDC050022]
MPRPFREAGLYGFADGIAGSLRRRLSAGTAAGTDLVRSVVTDE